MTLASLLERLALLAALLLVGCTVLCGCGQYQLSGLVVDGPRSQVLVVDRDDPRLDQAGIADVDVQMVLDPKRLNRELLDHAVSDSYGRFVLNVNTIGGSYLQNDVRVAAQAPGYAPAVRDMSLPGASKALLITLTSGSGTAGVREDLLDETLRLGEPYLKDTGR